jgi:hypothetical protein
MKIALRSPLPSITLTADSEGPSTVLTEKQNLESQTSIQRQFGGRHGIFSFLSKPRSPTWIPYLKSLLVRLDDTWWLCYLTEDVISMICYIG